LTPIIGIWSLVPVIRINLHSGKFAFIGVHARLKPAACPAFVLKRLDLPLLSSGNVV
jgi:hypothetical protein